MISSFIQTLGSGLWILLPQFAVTLVLLVAGAAIYMRITPYDERHMVEDGNLAGGVVLGGAILALSIPLAATLATSHTLLDILIWGVVALILQLVAFAVANLVLPGLRRNVESGKTAAAIALVGIQVAVALINAAAMTG